MIFTTEHDTEVSVSDQGGAHVEVTLYGGLAYDEPVYLSLTPREARRLADALLNTAQPIEDRLPHANS